MASVEWKNEPEEHDYPAAETYLSLLTQPDVAARIVADLRVAEIVHQKAKDILRASGLALLGAENAHVAADLEKVHKGHALSPVLLVRGDLGTERRLQIADGYHRMCAVYSVDEDTPVPCKIV